MTMPVVLLCGQAGAGKDTVGEFLRDRCDAVLLAQADPMKRFVRRIFGFDDHNLWGPSEAREALVEVHPVDTVGAMLALKDLLVELEVDVTLDQARPAFERWYAAQVVQAVTLGGYVTQKHYLAARGVLQTLGTEFGRVTLGAKAWSRHALSVARRLLRGGFVYQREVGLTSRPGAPPAPLVTITDGRFINEVLDAREAGALPVLVTGRRSGVVGNASHTSETELARIPRHFFRAVLGNTGSLDSLRDMTQDLVNEHFHVVVRHGALGFGMRSTEQISAWR